MRGRRLFSPGFVLLEVVLALALFAAVATALTAALHQLAASTTSARRESLLLRRLQSELAESAYGAQLVPGHAESPPDAFGISVSRDVERLRLTSRSGAALDGLYRIRVSASMSQGPGNRDRLVREMETYSIRFAELQAPPASPVAQPVTPGRPDQGTAGIRTP